MAPPALRYGPAHLLDLCASSMRRPRLLAAEPDERGVTRSNEPQEHARQIYPYGMLHANDTILLWRWMARDVDTPKQAKQCCPEDEEYEVPRESPVAFEEWNAVDDAGECAQAGDNFSIYPFAIGINTSLATVV